MSQIACDRSDMVVFSTNSGLTFAFDRSDMVVSSTNSGLTFAFDRSDMVVYSFTKPGLAWFTVVVTW